MLTVIVTVEIATLQLFPVRSVSCSEWRMFQPTVIISFMIGDGTTALSLFSSTLLSTMAETFSLEVPNVGTPVINIVLNTNLEFP